MSVSFGAAANRKQLASPVPGAWKDGETYGPWKDQFGSYGVIVPVGKNLSMQPEVAASPAQTESCLVTSVSTFGTLDVSATMTTLKQLRTGSQPNPWEVAWFLWHYTSNANFYSLVLKPNGWELGKEDPAYIGAQRFLRTGSTPTFPIGVPYPVSVIHDGAEMAVSVNCNRLVSYTDTERPYMSGSIGCYCEDSHVQFAPVTVNGQLLVF